MNLFFLARWICSNQELKGIQNTTFIVFVYLFVQAKLCALAKLGTSTELVCAACQALSNFLCFSICSLEAAKTCNCRHNDHGRKGRVQEC